MKTALVKVNIVQDMGIVKLVKITIIKMADFLVVNVKKQHKAAFFVNSFTKT
jgi:hypothetical protein